MKNMFTTELSAISAQVSDFQMYKDSQSALPANYWLGTTEWASVRKRADADEWYYEVCPEGVQTHVQKASQASWVEVD